MPPSGYGFKQSPALGFDQAFSMRSAALLPDRIFDLCFGDQPILQRVAVDKTSFRKAKISGSGDHSMFFVVVDGTLFNLHGFPLVWSLEHFQQ